jgi:hypothetical protein
MIQYFIKVYFINYEFKFGLKRGLIESISPFICELCVKSAIRIFLKMNT